MHGSGWDGGGGSWIREAAAAARGEGRGPGTCRQQGGRDDPDGGENRSGAGSWATNGGGSGSGLPSGEMARAVRRQRREQVPRPERCRGPARRPSRKTGPCVRNSDCSGMAVGRRIQREPAMAMAQHPVHHRHTHVYTRRHTQARTPHAARARARAHTHTHTHTDMPL